MAEFPALPLWTDAYLGDTVHLTTIEHGAYLLLLMTAWRARSHDLPDDDRMLARYCRLTVGQWRRIRPTLEPFWMVANGRWSNRRLLDELDAVRQARAQRSDAGRASALKRKHRGSTGVPTKLQREGNTLPIPIVGKELVGNTESESEDRSPDGKIAVSPKRNGHDQVEAAFDAWNAFAQTHGLPTVQKRTTARRAALRRRLADGGGLDGWQAALDKAASIPWMLGENPRGWRLNLTTLVREEFFAKLMEGAYDKATGLSAAQAWLAKQSAP